MSESLKKKKKKSLCIVSATAVAVLTQEREISTCPQHIPGLTLNITHFPSNPVQYSQTLDTRSVISRRQVTVLQNRFTPQTECEAQTQSISGISDLGLFQIICGNSPRKSSTAEGGKSDFEGSPARYEQSLGLRQW